MEHGSMLCCCIASTLLLCSEPCRTKHNKDDRSTLNLAAKLVQVKAHMADNSTEVKRNRATSCKLCCLPPIRCRYVSTGTSQPSAKAADGYVSGHRHAHSKATALYGMGSSRYELRHVICKACQLLSMSTTTMYSNSNGAAGASDSKLAPTTPSTSNP